MAPTSITQIMIGVYTEWTPSAHTCAIHLHTQLVLDLLNRDLRENALLELSKKREAVPDLAPFLWYSVGMCSWPHRTLTWEGGDLRSGAQAFSCHSLYGGFAESTYLFSLDDHTLMSPHGKDAVAHRFL